MVRNWSEWLSDQPDRADVKLAALATAVGLPLERACALFLRPPDPARATLGQLEAFLDRTTVDDSPRVAELSSLLSEMLFATPVEKMVPLVELAIRRKESLLRDSKTSPSLMNAIGTEVIDRVAGKPTQTIETKNLSVVYSTSNDVKRLEADLEASLRRLERIKQEKAKILSASTR